MPSKKTDPQIIEMPCRKMAVVTTHGEPGAEIERVMKALFGAAYTLKFARKKQDPALDFRVECPRARWPNAHEVPKDQWIGIWGLPVPDDVTELPQKEPGIEVMLDTWAYGTVAQALHLGPYLSEGPTVARLHEFIEEQGYELAGPHEEEYQTRPTAKVVKTVIRYEVRKRA
jgi:hypothetical protein